MIEFKFSSFPIIETERLILREHTEDDLPQLFELRSNREIMKNIDKPSFQDMQEARDQLERMRNGYATSTGLSWGITLKKNGDDKVIAGCGLWRIIREHYRAEIGYAVLPQYWNQGIISEAIKAVCEFGFEKVGLHSIEANLSTGNIRSARVLEKNGFIKEAHFKENHYYDGKFVDTFTYGKLKDP
jgi:[ribosomal protein S5]-alanine N-acetyltransferase